MRAPKPGDRVRVSYEGVVLSRGHFSYISPADGFETRIPADATIEVLASPVYENHETTEYRFGDVVKDAGGNTLFRTERGWRWCAFDGDGPSAPMLPLTLLVRRGQPVPS